MHKLHLLIGTLLLIFLAACSPAEAISTAVPAAQSSDFDENSEAALPAEAQLALGTILLDSTNLAIDANQAYQLLPLWQTASSLAVSNHTEGVEMSAVTGRIIDTLSTEQIAAISAMQLTQSTVDEMILAGTLEIPMAATAGIDRDYGNDLANIDDSLLETSPGQQDIAGEALSSALSATLTEQVVELLETKVG